MHGELTGSSGYRSLVQAWAVRPSGSSFNPEARAVLSLSIGGSIPTRNRILQDAPALRIKLCSSVLALGLPCCQNRAVGIEIEVDADFIR